MTVKVLDDPKLNAIPTFSVGYKDPETGDYIYYREGLNEKDADAEVQRNMENGFLSFKKEEHHEAAQA